VDAARDIQAADTKHELPAWGNTNLRLNLGSGERPLPGFVNVDTLRDAPEVDVIADVTRRLPFEDASAELVYAVHLLEHVAADQVPGVLADWRRVLRPGGVLMVAVPDLDAIARILVERAGWFTPPHNPWLGAIYGGQKDEWDFHKTGFTAPWLAHLLEDAGFGEVRRVERFEEIGLPDASVSPQPFGVNISLNMRAVAGAGGVPPELVTPSRLERAFNPFERALSFGMAASTALRSRVMLRRRRALEDTFEAGGPERRA
jgi:predicted SAM-dependent methyltransferase